MASRAKPESIDWEDDEQGWEVEVESEGEGEGVDEETVPSPRTLLKHGAARRSIEQLMEEKRLRGYLADVFDDLDE